MNESKKRTLFVTVLFIVVLICLLVIFLMQMHMQRTLAQIAAVQATNTQAATLPPSSDAGETQTQTEPESQSESVRSIAAESAVSGMAAKTSAPPVKTEKATETEKPKQLSEQLVVNTNTRKIHSPDCSYAKNIKPDNRADISAGDLQEYLDNGYALCGHCEGCAK